jgi:hypothetical protein
MQTDDFAAHIQRLEDECVVLQAQMRQLRREADVLCERIRRLYLQPPVVDHGTRALYPPEWYLEAPDQD